MVRFWLRLVRTWCGRALVAWCALFFAAHFATAQYLMYDGPPRGMDPEREEQFVEDESILATDDEGQGGPGDAMVTDGDADAGPQVGPQYGAPYEYIEEQGMPFIMQQEGGAYQPGSFYNPDAPPPPPKTYCRCMQWFGFRHSYTHGRSVGWGQPLVGSSWLNRPYYIGTTLGPMWLTNRPIAAVARDKDVMGTIQFGWDWDYYWGSEFQYGYATPELWNSAAPDGSPLGHRLATWNYSFLYYPWGDSKIRPFWRLGVGDTHFDFTTNDGLRRDEWLFTSPFGVGIKYPLRRWLAGRIEFTDQLSWGGHGVATQHNLVLQFGLELRFGGKQKTYYPWNPNVHVW